MSEMDITNMSIDQIRKQLKKHGLDTKGKKSELAARYINYTVLMQKLENEDQNDEGEDDDHDDDNDEGSEHNSSVRGSVDDLLPKESSEVGYDKEQEEEEEEDDGERELMYPEELVKDDVVEEIKKAANLLKVYVYPVSPDDWGNGSLLTMLDSCRSYTLRCMYPEVSHKHHGILELAFSHYDMVKEAQDTCKIMFPNKKVETLSEDEASLRHKEYQDKVEGRIGMEKLKDEQDKRTVCVYGFPSATTEEEVLELFGGHLALLVRDGEGKPTGTAFVEFDTEEEVQASLSQDQRVVGDVKLAAFPLSEVPTKAIKLMTDKEVHLKVYKLFKARENISINWYRNLRTPELAMKAVESIEKDEEELETDRLLKKKKVLTATLR